MNFNYFCEIIYLSNKRMNKLLYISGLLITIFSFSQEKIIHKELIIKRVHKGPKIDAILDDIAWQNTSIAKDFIMFRPENGKPEPQNIKTEVRMAYDDEAIYIGAYLYDDKPQEIPMEFQTRDKFGNADFFLVALSPSNDGINSTEFVVMSSGTQNDAIVTSQGEDWSWNAVWESKARITDNGWIVEMKIPYSALRFSNEKIQTWGINFHRQHRNSRDQYSWNYVDNNKGNVTQYDGVLKGIENIKPPTRLSFNPYIYGASANFAGITEFDWNVGMDIKYGLSENFTLDATLIPDFGQAGFDNERLNLGPFEQKYSEKRSFFTEGVDLFSKGDLFYSRRVGNSPIGRSFTIDDDETIIENPKKVNLLNAIKISGRTKKGLGIGIFNAITQKTNALIKNTLTNTTREIETEPLANYNVLVLDQQFNKNSSVSLVNTNVLRSGSSRDANVTGLLFNLNNKHNTYGMSGGIAMSNINENEIIKSGFEGRFDVDKTSGKHRFGIGMDFKNKNYDKNDLGYMRRNNNIQYDAYYSFRILKPYKNFNNINVSLSSNIRYLLDLDKTTPSYQTKPNLYTGNFTNLRLMATTKKNLTFGGSLKTTLGNQYDYYGPKNLDEGRFYIDKPFIGFSAFMSTSYSKKFAFDISLFRGVKYDATRNYTDFDFSPRYRFNNQFNLVYSFNYSIGHNEKGLVNFFNDAIIYGNRDNKSITNAINAIYNFTTKSALSLSFRHNWNPVTYDSNFYELNYDGTLSDSNYNPINDFDDTSHNVNFNSWNVDLNFKWEFAPGSELVALYRNQIGTYNRDAQLGFNDNLSKLFKEDQLNSISIKLIYYLDYNQVKTWL